MPYQFEFDPQKSEANRRKHGIDFVAAQALWSSRLLEFPAKDAEEKRYLVIGKIQQQNWTAIVTYRGMTIRLISVRKSSPGELTVYAARIF